ncbi:MAG: hypothetical protein ACREBG_13230 [Pyrinomonadaceae bacterium]
MKHCPQCEFTFDDQQQFCDFDGTELSVIPEPLPPSFKSVLLAPAASRSFVRRLVQSRVSMATLALAGLVLSALLIGYYDSVNQPNSGMSNSQTRNDTASMVPSTQVETATQAGTQVNRPRIISTQRRIGADELPSSMAKRLLEGSRSRSAKSGRSPSTNKLVSTKRGPSRSKLVATKRGPSRSKLVTTKRRPENVNRQSQTRNQSRPNSAERGRRQHSVARVTNRRPGWGTNDRGTNESAHHRKDSKVIAILKKTGSILKRKFELFAGR